MINSSINNKKIIVSFIFLIFIIITFQNITNNFSNDTFKSDKNESCELKTIDVVRFYEKTNIPILLNTSFNENEPIVESPEQAINCFLRTNMDILILENWMITRK